jgi:hypothetical protein
MKPVTRQKLNIIIDIIMFVVMVALAVIGFIIKYVLLSGTDRWVKYGRNVELTYWGLDRHQWGFIHLLCGLFLVLLLVLHIIFHWSMIVCMIKRLIPGVKSRVITIGSLIAVSILFIVFPFFMNPQTGEPIRGQGEGYGRTYLPDGERLHLQSVTDEQEKSQEAIQDLLPVAENSEQEEVSQPEIHQSGVKHEEARTLDIKGFNTIGELAAYYNVPAGELKRMLNIPEGVSEMEQLGRIRRVYGFSMREVEDCIISLQKKQRQ